MPTLSYDFLIFLLGSYLAMYMRPVAMVATHVQDIYYIANILDF
jgi:hypothetical protein